MAKSDKKYRVGKSKIQGKGVFSKQDLKPGDYIGKAHTINKLYTDYDFTELGKNHNHSDNPNVQNVLIGNERHFVATKPIKKGEELTTDYRLQPDLEQPEDFEKGGKMTPQKDGYRSYSPYKDLPYIEVDSNVIDTDGIVHDLLLVGNDGSQKFVEKNTGTHVLPNSERVTEYPVKAKTGEWLDAYDVPQAQNGIEGTMGGLTDKGFNFNPAWGGAWQNGGKLQPPMAGAVQTVPMAQNGRSTALQDFLKMSSARKEFEPSASITPRVDMIGLPGNMLVAIPGASLDARPIKNLSVTADVSAPITFSKEGIGAGENLNYNIGAGYQLNRNNYIGARYGNNQGFGLDFRHTLFNKNKKKEFQTGGNIGTRPEDEDIREIYEWEKEYTNSPRFAYLSSKQGDSPEITQRRRDVINKFNIDKDIVRVPEGVSYVGDEGGGLKFYLSPDAGDWPSYSDINAHEIGHFPYNTGELNFPESTYNEIQARNKEFQKMKASGIVNDDIEHDISPNEVRADKNQLLYQMKKLGIYDATKDGDITPEQLDKFKKSGQWNRLQRLYNDDDILWLINNVAQNTSGVSDKAFVGASIPGSTGFTYARTQGAAPSEGPYAKKTMPSAQDGKSVQQKRYDDLYYPVETKILSAIGTDDDYFFLPPSTRNFLEKTISGYNPKSNRNIPPMDPIIKEVQEKIKKLPKEEINELLKTDWSKIGLIGAMRNTPSSVSYTDMLKYINHFNKLKKQGYTLQNGGSMAYYQAGLDFKPKTISRDGSSVNRADEYPLEKLDNLLNFTNYNKPKAKSGGWLDKYN